MYYYIEKEHPFPASLVAIWDKATGKTDSLGGIEVSNIEFRAIDPGVPDPTYWTKNGETHSGNHADWLGTAIGIDDAMAKIDAWIAEENRLSWEARTENEGVALFSICADEFGNDTRAYTRETIEAYAEETREECGWNLYFNDAGQCWHSEEGKDDLLIAEPWNWLEEPHPELAESE